MLAAVSSVLPVSDRGAAPVRLADSRGTLTVRIGGSIGQLPSDASGQRRQELLVRLAHVLSGRLPAAVPLPLTVVSPGPDLPFGAVTYPLLPGRPMAPWDEDTWPAI